MGALEVNTMTSRAWRAALAGDLDCATDLASQAWTHALRDGDRRAADGAAVQLAYLLWQRGRAADLLPFTELDSTPTFASRLIPPRCLAAGAAPEATRATFEALTTAELCELPHDLFWSSTLIAAAEAAFMLDLPELGATVHDLLEPFRYQLAFANFAIAPIAYGAGLAAAASRRIEYESLFADALAICARLRAPVLHARTEIAFAIATCTSGVTPDRVRADPDHGRRRQGSVRGAPSHRSRRQSRRRGLATALRQPGQLGSGVLRGPREAEELAAVTGLRRDRVDHRDRRLVDPRNVTQVDDDLTDRPIEHVLDHADHDPAPHTVEFAVGLDQARVILVPAARNDAFALPRRHRVHFAFPLMLADTKQRLGWFTVRR